MNMSSRCGGLPSRKDYRALQILKILVAVIISPVLAAKIPSLPFKCKWVGTKSSPHSTKLNNKVTAQKIYLKPNHDFIFFFFSEN